MAKVKVPTQVLEYNRMLMTKIGIYPSRLDEPTSFFKSPVIYYFLFFTIPFQGILSAMGVWENWPNIDLVLDGTLLTIGSIQCGGMYLNTGLKMEQVGALNVMLQQIVDEGEAEGDIFINIYRSAEKKCQQITKYMCAAFVIIQVDIMVPGLLSFYHLIVGNWDTSTWILPYTMYAPFGMDTFAGWYLMWFIEFNVCFGYGISMYSTTSYFMSNCVYIGAICDHFNAIIDAIKKDMERNRGEKNPVKHRKRCEKIRANLIKSVNVHLKIYEAFDLIESISGGSIFALLPLNVIYFAFSLYFAENITFDMALITYIVACVVCSASWPFIFCYYADVVTTRIAAIGDIAYDLEWFELQPELQKYIVLMINRSQKPVRLTGFGLITCSLETFGKLFKTSCSYYLFFRKI